MKNLQREQGGVFPELPPAFDRRRRERVGLKIPLRILTYGMLVDKASDGTCTDLSEGGVSFDCDAELNVGDIVILRVPPERRSRLPLPRPPRLPHGTPLRGLFPGWGVRKIIWSVSGHDITGC